MPKKIAGFFSESIQGAGGNHQFPKGYMKEVYEIVRSRGGLCLADEVQTGLGRLGSHFWGFEHHDVTPDIVTIAKGIGNGFPLAAVVTTEEIFNSLDDAFYFNTFGGSALGCSVGSAVL
ncbi:aminotransferase class III-fold pyridoxal phosphate-dependent enzyme, partial [Salmonella sp. s55044]